MTITNLAGLKAACADALVRSDFDARIAESVPLAEAWLNRNLRLRIMQAEASLTTTPGARTVTLPGGFLEPLALFRVTSQGRKALIFRPAVMETRSGAEAPEEWTVDGGGIAFPAPADAAHALTLRLLQRLALRVDSDSNGLLTAWPDLYLAALLVAVTGVYLTDDPRLAAWKISRDELLAEVNAKEARSGALAQLVADDSFTSEQRSNNRAGRFGWGV